MDCLHRQFVGRTTYDHDDDDDDDDLFHLAYLQYNYTHNTITYAIYSVITYTY